MQRRLLPLTLVSALLLAVPLCSPAKEKSSKYAGIYKGETRAQDETREQSRDGAYATRHHTITLSLGADGTATLTQSPDATSETTSFGHWTHEGDQIKLTFDPAGDQPAPPPISFRVHKKTLTPVIYNHDLWRELPPPPLQRMNANATNND